MIQLQEILSNPITSIPLTAIIDTALCVGAGGSSGSLADKPIVRTGEGKLLIPASQFKGRLRHECEKIARGLNWPICESPKPARMCPQRAGFPELEAVRFNCNNYLIDKEQSYRTDGDENSPVEAPKRYHCLICQIFGNPSLSSRVIFDDLICTESPDNLAEVLRPGVTLNRSRRTAEDQKLYFLETSPACVQLRFEGAIHLQPNCPAYAKALILAGLHHIHALGGSKSAGLGWLSWEWDAEKLQVNDEDWRSLLPGGKP